MSKEDIQVVFRLRLAETLTPIVERLEGGRESVEELWTSLKNTIHEVAMETIGQNLQHHVATSMRVSE